MCGHLNLKLAVGLNVRSIFIVLQSAPLLCLLCNCLEKKKKEKTITTSTIICILICSFYFCLSLSSLVGSHAASGMAGL